MHIDFASIIPYLFVGPCPPDQEDFEHLRSRGVTAILSLLTAEDMGQRGMQWEESAARSASMCFRNVPVRDFDMFDLGRMLPACVSELKRLLGDGHTVYVHCTGGVTRSPTVAVAYLHWCLGWPLEQALTRVREARNCCPLGNVIRRAHWPL